MGGFGTRAIRSGLPRDAGTGARVEPIFLTTTFAQHHVGTPTGSYIYSRSANPNRERPAIFVDPQKAGPLSTEAIAVSLVLKVTSKSAANLPKVIDVKRSFTLLTFLSTVPSNGTPTIYPGLGSSMKRGLRRESFKLSKFKLTPITWERVADSGSGKADGRDESVYICHLNIPIYPTVDMDMIPTLYSCLTARQYFAKFSLSFPSQSLGLSSILLEVPVDNVYVNSQVQCAEHTLK